MSDFNLTDSIYKILAAGDQNQLESISEAFESQILSDDEPGRKKGRAMLLAYLNGDVDDFCIALTGWSFENILKRAGVIEDYDGVFDKASNTAPYGSLRLPASK